MKLYLNEQRAIKKRDIVGIFDLDTATVSRDTRAFLRKKEKEGSLYDTATDIPVSFIVEKTEHKNLRVYMTRNAPKVLRRRAERFGM